MDLVKPEYYNNGNIDVIEYIKVSQGKQAAIEFCRGNILKYVTRFDKKNGMEDLQKAQTYIKRLSEIYSSEKITKRSNSKKIYTNFVDAVDGVRRIKGFDLYQCAYNCSCGNDGVRYVKEDDEITTCHRCKNELIIQPSTDNDAHDEDFNYFIAY